MSINLTVTDKTFLIQMIANLASTLLKLQLGQEVSIEELRIQKTWNEREKEIAAAMGLAELPPK
jgi:hypothetical protein